VYVYAVLWPVACIVRGIFTPSSRVENGLPFSRTTRESEVPDEVQETEIPHVLEAATIVQLVAVIVAEQALGALAFTRAVGVESPEALYARTLYAYACSFVSPELTYDVAFPTLYQTPSCSISYPVAPVTADHERLISPELHEVLGSAVKFEGALGNVVNVRTLPTDVPATFEAMAQK
jgi:hypothetical protein